MKPNLDRYWCSEEFEDLVAKTIIAMYEDERFYIPPKPISPTGKQFVLVKHRLADKFDLQVIKRTGPYFSPGDRETMFDDYFYEVDGLPDQATLAWNSCNRSPDHFSGYLELFSAKRISAFPKECQMLPAQYVAKYRAVALYPQEKGGFDGGAFYFGVTRSSRVLAEIFDRSNDNENEVRRVMASAILGLYADRRYLWNVSAIEQDARATFGVYEDQIKSLFYARSVPTTETGRKRPILHWVSSHKRRTTRGIDVDIKKHLRGITEFEMGGTVFKITRPTKEQRAA